MLSLGDLVVLSLVFTHSSVVPVSINEMSERYTVH